MTVAALREQFPKVDAWESGEAQPTFRQLEDLAKKTASPFGYLFLAKPPEERLPVPDFRTVRKGRIKQPSVNLVETLQTMQRRQDWMRDFLVEQGSVPLEFIASIDLRKRPEAVAANIGEVLKLPEDFSTSESGICKRGGRLADRLCQSAVDQVPIASGDAIGVKSLPPARRNLHRRACGTSLARFSPLKSTSVQTSRQGRLLAPAIDMGRLQYGRQYPWRSQQINFARSFFPPRLENTRSQCPRTSQPSLLVEIFA